MKTTAEAIAFNIRASKGMLDAFTADLKGTDWEHRPAPGANCAAWLLGHLILTDRNILRMVGVTDLPELPAGFETTFSRSESAAAAAHFGDTSILVPMFDHHRELLIAAVLKMPESRFVEDVPKPSPRFTTYGEMLLIMGIHVAMHSGQISTIRRSLGRPPLF